jgi:hypothetical protein
MPLYRPAAPHHACADEVQGRAPQTLAEEAGGPEIQDRAVEGAPRAAASPSRIP